jgi:hypothetical protein
MPTLGFTLPPESQSLPGLLTASRLSFPICEMGMKKHFYLPQGKCFFPTILAQAESCCYSCHPSFSDYTEQRLQTHTPIVKMSKGGVCNRFL